MTQGQQKIWAVVAHIGMALLPFGSGLGAMIMYLIFRDRSRYVAHHAYQAMWFFFTVWLASFVLAIFLPNVLVFGAAWIFTLVMTAIASVSALSGTYYEYPVIGRIWRRALGS